MTGIAFFVVDRMSSYLTGGMKLKTAARFTRGELEAIYKGNHRSRDTSGAFRVTPPPEPLPITMAMKKADEAITEILNAETKQPETRTAPETKPMTAQDTALNGFEKMANYAKRSA